MSQNFITDTVEKPLKQRVGFHVVPFQVFEVSFFFWSKDQDQVVRCAQGGLMTS